MELESLILIMPSYHYVLFLQTLLSFFLSTCGCTFILICTLQMPSHPLCHFAAAHNPQADPLCREVITCQLCLFLAITPCSLLQAVHSLSYPTQT